MQDQTPAHCFLSSTKSCAHASGWCRLLSCLSCAASTIRGLLQMQQCDWYADALAAHEARHVGKDGPQHMQQDVVANADGQ